MKKHPRMVTIIKRGDLTFIAWNLINPSLYRHNQPPKNKLKHLEGKFVKMPDVYAKFSLQKLHNAVLYVNNVSKPFGAVNDCVDIISCVISANRM